MFARPALRRPGIGIVAVPATGVRAYSADEKMDQIRKLGEMKKEGILTYAEFEAQKQRLLS